MNIFSKITAKTMRANRVRTIVTIIGVILSTSMITAVATFGTSFQRFLVDYSISTNGNWHVAASGTDAAQAGALAKQEDVANAAILKTLGYAWFEPVTQQSPSMPYLYVRSLSKEALAMLPAQMQEGRMPETEDEIAVPSFLLANEAEGNETQVGDRLTLDLGERSYQGERLDQHNEYMDDEYEDDETFTPLETRTFTVVGIYSAWPDVSFWAPGYDVLAGPTDRETAYQDVFIELKNPRKVYDFADENITDEKAGILYNASLLRWMGIADNSNLNVVLMGLLILLIIVIMAGSITLIYNAFSISLRERTVQFGLLSSIGATKKQLRKAMRYEAFFVSAVGIPLGILAGAGGIGVTLRYIGGGLSNWIHGTKAGIPLYVPLWAVASAAVIAFVTIMVSVWIPSRRIRKITPMEAIRSSTDIRIKPNEVRTGTWILSLFGLEGMMAQKNYKRDRRKYRATVISLTMSIGLFTAAGLFNLYLLQTGAFVLEAPDTDVRYTLYADVQEQEEDVQQVLKRTEGIDSVSKHYVSSLDFGIPKEWAGTGLLSLYSQELPAKDGMAETAWIHATMIILGDEDFKTFAREQNVKASAYQNSDHVKVLYLNCTKNFNTETERYEKQDIFPEKTTELLPAGYLEYDEEGMPEGFHQTMQFELADAVSAPPEAFAEYSDRIVMFLPESMYLQFIDSFQEGLLNAVYSIRCENAADTFRELETGFSEQHLSDVGYLENVREEFETDQNTLVAVKVLTYGFVVLISLIAVANVFHTISTNLMLRRKEFAMLRSMGMSPKGFRKMMNFECLIYGIRSLIYGFLFTGLVSAALHRILGAGTDVEFLIPWGYLATAAAGVFLVVFLTMMYTMRVIQRNNIVEELKMN